MSQKSAVTAHQAHFSPPLQKIEQELAINDFVDYLLNPPENNISKVTLASLHEIHSSLKKRGIVKDHKQKCPHHRRFIQLVKNRAHYIASQGWILDQMNEGTTELKNLKKFLPKEDHVRIDREIKTLEKTRAIILEERYEQKKIFHQNKNVSTLLGKLKKIFDFKK